MENITIENCLNEEGMPSGLFTVKKGNRTADPLTWDEMLGLISQLTMPEERRCLSWMRTPEEVKKLEEYWRSKDNKLSENDFESPVK